jgi:glutamate dehydrogenase (NADP+)
MSQEAVKKFMEKVKIHNPNQPEFHQAVEEVALSIIPFIEKHTKYKKAKILERLTMPDRKIVFKVTWVDDKGEIHVNKGYRVQFNNTIGPYKGGLRFHPSVNISILKFLGFEQVFKNSLTTLPLGGAKGGSDFDPKGKTDAEVMRFCQAFMTELSKYIGPEIDVPAGDIGVGGREIGYLFGQYKRMNNRFVGVLTGKGHNWGGSLIRPEATGYGCVYFMEQMLRTKKETLEGKNCLISGSGNVAQYCAEKIVSLGGKVLTMSDSSGYIYDMDGIDEKKLEFIKELKNVKRGRIKEYIKQYKKAKYVEGEKPWGIKADLAFPCATQNEINKDDAKNLIKNGIIAVGEGANMPSTVEAINEFQKAKLLFSPGKASNAGGVATSGLEMVQNSMKLSWTSEEVDSKLKTIMAKIHTECVAYGKEGDYIDYVKGANIAGFIKVADAMLDQGAV